MSTAFEPTQPHPPIDSAGPDKTAERSDGMFAWVGAHGVLQAVLIVAAVLIVLVTLGGCADQHEAVRRAERAQLQQRLSDLEARLARDEYALLAVDRHTQDARGGRDRLHGGDAIGLDPSAANRARLIEIARQRVAAGAPIPPAAENDPRWTHGTWR
jgi:hypothetical protein